MKALYTSTGCSDGVSPLLVEWLVTVKTTLLLLPVKVLVSGCMDVFDDDDDVDDDEDDGDVMMMIMMLMLIMI